MKVGYMLPIRLRDFIEDEDGWIYAVSTYDNDNKIGCVLRYVPDMAGERMDPTGKRFKKYDFEDAFSHVAQHKPQYAGLVHRIPHADVKKILRPDRELARIARAHPRVQKLVNFFGLPEGTIGCTGSLLCELENESSDIDMVVYGKHWFNAQHQVKRGIESGLIEGMSPDMWRKVYEKRRPEVPYECFVLHEMRKYNRGQIDGTYFDILFTRSYDELKSAPAGKGEVTGKITIEAKVTDASLSFDNPAVYEVDHERVSRVLSFTHTYSGQALAGETIEACGVLEQHGNEQWRSEEHTSELQSQR